MFNGDMYLHQALVAKCTLHCLKLLNVAGGTRGFRPAQKINQYTSLGI